MQHQDLEVYFDLSDSQDADHLIEVTVGDLKLPTGEIMAGDPFFMDESLPFARRVQPGNYPVKLYIREIGPDDYRIAYAKVELSSEKADHWILAVSEDMEMEDLLKMQEDDFFGFAVDSGMACFLDAQTNEVYQQKMDELYQKDAGANYYDDVLAEELKEYSADSPYATEYGDWTNHFPDANSDLNVILFSSGSGEGVYPAYWGRNANKELTELIIDFMVDPESE